MVACCLKFFKVLVENFLPLLGIERVNACRAMLMPTSIIQIDRQTFPSRCIYLLQQIVECRLMCKQCLDVSYIISLVRFLSKEAENSILYACIFLLFILFLVLHLLYKYMTCSFSCCFINSQVTLHVVNHVDELLIMMINMLISMFLAYCLVHCFMLLVTLHSRLLS